MRNPAHLEIPSREVEALSSTKQQSSSRSAQEALALSAMDRAQRFLLPNIGQPEAALAIYDALGSQDDFPVRDYTGSQATWIRGLFPQAAQSDQTQQELRSDIERLRGDKEQAFYRARTIVLWAKIVLTRRPEGRQLQELLTQLEEAKDVFGKNHVYDEEGQVYALLSAAHALNDDFEECDRRGKKAERMIRSYGSPRTATVSPAQEIFTRASLGTQN